MNNVTVTNHRVLPGTASDMPFWEYRLLHGTASVPTRQFQEPAIHAWICYQKGREQVPLPSEVSLQTPLRWWVPDPHNYHSIADLHVLSIGDGASTGISRWSRRTSIMPKQLLSELSMPAQLRPFTTSSTSPGILLRHTGRAWLGRLPFGLFSSRNHIAKCCAQPWCILKLS